MNDVILVYPGVGYTCYSFIFIVARDCAVWVYYKEDQLLYITYCCSMAGDGGSLCAWPVSGIAIELARVQMPFGSISKTT